MTRRLVPVLALVLMSLVCELEYTATSPLFGETALMKLMLLLLQMLQMLQMLFQCCTVAFVSYQVY